MCAATALPGPKGFSDLYREYYPLAIQMIYGLDKDCRYAEDIVQDVFIKLFQQGNKLQSIECFKNYLFFSVRNRYISHKRKQKKYLVEELLEFELRDTCAADDRVRYKMTSVLIENAIRSLPKRRQQVFRMHRLEKMSHKEIAEHLGIHKVTVAEYIMVAVATLKTSLYSQCA